VAVEGTPEEVRKLLDFYGGGASVTTPGSPPSQPRKKQASKTKGADAPGRPRPDQPEDAAALSQIINLIKNCDEAEGMESRILDKTSQVNRVLLPLYVVHEYLENSHGLTSGEIAKITTDLGVPINQPNVAHTLSGTASKYVIGDRVRKKGQPVRYKMSRRGVKFLAAVIQGTEDGD
jgi:hypothetical protein